MRQIPIQGSEHADTRCKSHCSWGCRAVSAQAFCHQRAGWYLLHTLNAIEGIYLTAQLNACNHVSIGMICCRDASADGLDGREVTPGSVNTEEMQWNVHNPKCNLNYMQFRVGHRSLGLSGSLHAPADFGWWVPCLQLSQRFVNMAAFV